jgi:hypothetical protein
MFKFSVSKNNDKNNDKKRIPTYLLIPIVKRLKIIVE